MIARDAARALEEQAVGELHDVGLVHGRDAPAPLALGELEGVLRDPQAGVLGHDLEALDDAGRDAVLEARVEALGVLAHEDQVDALEARREARDRLHRPHAGEELERLAQQHVRALEAPADRAW